MGEALLIIQFIALAWPLVMQVIQMIQDAVAQAKANGTLTVQPASADKQAQALVLFQNLWPTIAQTGTGAKLVASTTPDQISSLINNLVPGLINGAVSIGNMFKSLLSWAQMPGPATPVAPTT